MNRTLGLLALGLGGLLAYRRWFRPRYDFRDRTVLITGGSRGLGLLLARQLCDAGARVAVCARDLDELDRAFTDLSQRRSGRVIAVPCDVTQRDQVGRLVQVVTRRLGPIDVLINNAGIIGVGPMELQRVEDYEEAMRTHFWASLYTTLECLPGMRQRKAGRIVNIASIGGKVAIPHMMPYTASKFALVGLSSGLRAELADEGITVTTVCPGLMRTGSHLHAEFKGQNDREYAWFALGNSIPGMSINADRAAALILDACARGDAELTFTLPARLAVALQGLMPNLMADTFAVAERWLLPGPEGGIGAEKRSGAESRGVLPGWVTTLTDSAAEKNNETTSAPIPASPVAQPSRL